MLDSQQDSTSLTELITVITCSAHHCAQETHELAVTARPATFGSGRCVTPTMRAILAGAALLGSISAQYTDQVGDVEMIQPGTNSWATGRFPTCPTECGQPASSVRRQVACKMGADRTTHMLGGLMSWQPAELAMNDERTPGYLKYKPDDMLYTAPMLTINVDDGGDLADWYETPIKAQTPFFPYNDKPGTGGGVGTTPAPVSVERGGPGCETMADKQCVLTMFDEHRGDRKWTALDHSCAISMAWDAQYFYLAVKVNPHNNLLERLGLSRCSLFRPCRSSMTRTRTKPTVGGTETPSRSRSPTRSVARSRTCESSATFAPLSPLLLSVFKIGRRRAVQLQLRVRSAHRRHGRAPRDAHHLRNQRSRLLGSHRHISRDHAQPTGAGQRRDRL